VSRAGTPGRDAVHIAVAVLTAVALLVGDRQALACPSCFGQAEGPLIDAARLGVWLLLGVTLGLQGGFAAFFLYLRRRSAQAATEHSRTTGPAHGASAAASRGA